ncbi:MAG: selenocysteine-specific translation elongation factor [Myxococcales bacterium]|jgi:selenocysteine-specific elongation factor
MRLVIGTAGHIDHGKTSLVKALTGIDTDRLREEKRRGITIELGFTQLALGGGAVAGVIDVPGHERFVKAMAAGAAGIDLVVLVIALDEGVMPQTREHLDICRLLGVPRGLVALTKGDLAAELGAEWIELLRADVAEACKGTFLEGAPVIQVSSKTGEGLDTLRRELERLAAQTPERPADGPSYLPIDRAFSLKGFGTVVTGTLLSGSIAAGGELDLIPGGAQRLRVRTVQVHGAEVERALAGQRTAVNLPGVEAGQISRGMVAVGTGVVSPTQIVDVELDLLAAAPRPLKDRSKLLLHLGTAQAPALVALIGEPRLEPGGRAFAQLRLGAPIAALPGQRFILRGFNAIPGRGHTVAGGRILSIHPRKRRGRRPEAGRGFAELTAAEPAPRVAYLLAEAGYRGLTALELFERTALPERQLARVLEVMSSRGEAILFDKERRAYLSPVALGSLARRALAAVRAHHAADSLSTGLSREELRRRLGKSLDPKLYARLLAGLVETGELELDGEVVRERGRQAASGDSDGKLKDEIARALSEAGLTPPYVAELPKLLGAPQAKVLSAVKLLEKQGTLVRVNQELYFDAAGVAGLRERLVAFLREHERITTQQFKELVGATRKYTIPLGEYFDREKVTLRVGDARVLRGGLR